MLKILLSQTGWNIAGTIFAFGVGFFVKMYLVNIVGASNFGLYIIATSFEAAIGTIVGLAIPSIILKFLPTYISINASDKATAFSTKFMIYSLVVGLLGGLFTMFLSRLIAVYLFNNEELETFIFLAAFYIPMSMFTAYITSIYRSILRIKEIILYSTLYIVSVRAILTFVVFSFTNDIRYFMYIELFTLSTAALLLLINFKSDKFKLFDINDISVSVIDNKIMVFGKKIYFMSLLSFFGGYMMTFIMSITLPSKSIGIYAILTTISGLTTFLLSNINRVFSPIISSLVAQKNFTTLSIIYKESTFLINILTIPFIIIVVLFAKKILGLYGYEFENYTFELTILFLGNYASISVGSSGTMMVMGGVERQELYIQIIKLFGISIASFIFIPIYGLVGAVFIYAFFMLFVNVAEVFFIYKNLHIFPLDKYILWLFMLFVFSLLLINTNHQVSFKIWEYVAFPILIYIMYFVLFYKKIFHIINIVKRGEY